MLNSERLKSISYSKQAVCVLDVLGFSNEIKNDKNYIDPIAIMMNTLSEFSEKANSVNVIKSAFFSDSIFLASNLENIAEIFKFIALLQLKIITHQIFIDAAIEEVPNIHTKLSLLRGGIVYDDVHFDIAKSIYFGPAIVTAHEIEEKVAIYPRVIIDDSVFSDDTFARLKLEQYLNVNSNLKYFNFVKYLVDMGELNDQLINHLLDNVENEIFRCSNQRIKDKYIWMKNYLYCELESMKKVCK